MPIPQTIAAADGVQLQVSHWSPTGMPRGTVLIVHGLGEHIGRYQHVAAHLNAHGWLVAGYDQRGHGASEGKRGAVPQPEALLDDLARVMDAVRALSPDPLVLLGHSMGGLVAARFAAEMLSSTPAEWSRPVDALVLSSPALALPMTPGQQRLLAVMSRMAPGVAVGNGLKPEWISRDPAVVAAYQADTLVHDRVTARLVRFMLDGGERVREQASRWRLPTLLMYAGADRCVAPSGSDAFAATAPRAKVRIARYDGLAHEIFNEPEKARVLDDLTGWLAHLARHAR
jgi:alpha-beta hydrolase superfamily lysophospholipase